MRRQALAAAIMAMTLSTSTLAADLWQVYQDAVQQDPELAIERTRLDQAQARVSEATSRLLPSINATADWSNTSYNVGDDTDNLALSLTAEQVLFSGPAWYARSAAQQAFSLAEAQFRDAEQNLLLRTAEAYFNVLRAEDNLSALQAEEQAIQRQLDQVREQYEVGLIAITDVLEAQAAYDGVHAARIGAEGSLLISYEALEQLTGQSYPQLHVLVDQTPVTPPTPNTRESWIEMALNNNLALQSAAAGVRTAQEALRAERSGHLPSVALYASHRNNSEATPQGVDTTTVVGVRAQLELYGGGRTSSQIAASTSGLEEAGFSEELARRQVLQQTRSLFTQVNTDVLTVQAQAQAIRSAESALEATRIGYEVGTRNIVDVLNAERAVWGKQRDYDAARYNYLVNQLRLKRAAGSLSRQDLQDLNRWLTAEAMGQN